jgi:phenylalanyl-tRNA synthetase beta chain
MKFTLSWLQDHLETDASAAVIAERLTMIGLEVEAVVDRGAEFKDFVVAEVIDCQPHPNADKLRVCKVDTGRERLSIICGAPNARAGMKGVFAPVGAYIPGLGLTLKAAAIRGIESRGMLLSEREMAMSDAHTGIIELPATSRVGAPAASAMGLGDPLIDVAITPNRGDCLGVRGIARDLAASGLGQLKPLAVEPVGGSFDSPVRVRLELPAEAAGACPYFVGRTIRGVHNGDSPQWLKDRLLAVGLRPISALVDITNYMTIDLCRPLHAFDADRLQGDLQVRLAKADERFLALNGREYVLSPQMTVIADDAGADALGGIIGGERTACTAATTTVVLESALFDPVRTASTGRELAITSDARYRFERGIDPAFLIDGMEIATRLVLACCGGVASHLVVAGGEPPRQSPVTFRPARVSTLAGVDLPPADCAAILEHLGFATVRNDDDGPWSVQPPPWRHDIAGEACIVEEIVRIVGYDRIAQVSLGRVATLPAPALTPEQARRAMVRRLLAGRGLDEAVTYSFLAATSAALFGGATDSLRLVNPISADLDVMRPSLLPNLLVACGRNADRGQRDAALFEVAPQYAGPEPDEQSIVAAGVRTGRTGARHWAEAPRPVDAFDVKADVLAVLAALELPLDKLTLSTDAPSWYHPGRSASIRLGPKTVLARFGELHPRVLNALGVKGAAAGFEILLDAVPARKARSSAAKPPLRPMVLQPVERDFAFTVDDSVTAEALVRAVRAADRTLIQDVAVFDLFQGTGLAAGKKSVGVTVTLQPTDRTLTDAEIEAIAERIVGGVGKATGGELRS